MERRWGAHWVIQNSDEYPPTSPFFAAGIHRERGTFNNLFFYRTQVENENALGTTCFT